MALLNDLLRNSLRRIPAVVVVCILGAGFSLRAASNEYQIKAAFLLNFVEFVDWPPAAFPPTASVLTIGILGDDPFGPVLDETVRGEQFRSQKLAIKRSRRAEDLRRCQLVFICKSEMIHLPAILAVLSPNSVLTIGEASGFAENGGIINFYREGSKIRFEINSDAARQEGIKVSSQLLSLGKIVRSAENGKGA